MDRGIKREENSRINTETEQEGNSRLSEGTGKKDVPCQPEGTGEKDVPCQPEGTGKKDIPGLTAEEGQAAARALLSWYRRNKRDLPWRRNPTPYQVWVSEIMLQQTRVEAVKPYYERFLRELPDAAHLAACPEEKLLKLWEGLGYYSRVRNMQAAAKQVMEEYDGRLPDDVQKLLRLKGIGSYTAGAIASIAYGIPVPAIDGNALRVAARVLESREDIRTPAFHARVEKLLLSLLPAEDPGGFNQAVMDLGASICVPNGQTKCEVCPLASACRSRQNGTASEIPVKPLKKTRETEERTVLVIQDGAWTLLHRRPGKGLLAGMYELPNVKGFLNREEALLYVQETGLEPLFIQALPDAKHVFTHLEWRMKAYLVRVSSLEKKHLSGFVFADKKGRERIYPIPSAFRAYVKYMKEEETE